MLKLESVGSVNIPKISELQLLTIDAKELKKLRRAKIINLEAYVYLALKIQYGDKSRMRIHSESFCQDWKILPHEMGAAVAKLQKKGLIGCNAPEFIQLELFRLDDEDV
ncbi:MAG: hypothetical protein F6K14_11695 [Symploca sp. SIO2C1]|nr:hypothetical protein [Symploca sp. SIO2C1]